MKRYEIEIYLTEAGHCPFEEWNQSLKDAKARLAIMARIQRAATGDFGDWKSITGAKGVFEMRIHYAQGYRLFYTIVGTKIVLLLAGSTKKEQDRTIAKAKDYLADYNSRAKI
ncbi:type II toxin-antitoxin system RelE/ParE family toxin [Rhizobium sp. C4]|uniref:type II toxin-antitoxin system RelE/ParE family toxin n=1 Tax=Rhizobium sp. C4 TaxID=1349800 RepID=UPI001E3F3584|nr:type II toxin-antitoxin system RelE/ParE family toxin [Rhizobium sp. C4]MCD2173337.1 type II toxin-antitoxin system RelE/ParE family toxin [Rhizobium sp. C4]